MTKSRELDQFYTNPKLSERVLRLVDGMYGLSKYTLIEPSAGSGSFYNLMLGYSGDVYGYDLEPKADGVVEADFLTLDTGHISGDKFYIGNPPFGRNSSLALKFLNKCSEDCSYVAMILPRTFSKRLFQNKVNLNLHLDYEAYVPPKSFILDGVAYDVPCTFQVWERRGYKRRVIEVDNTLFERVSREDAEYSIRRVGGRAGMVLEGVDYSPSSTYFVRDLKVGVRGLIKDNYDLIREEASKTVGVRSITTDEIAMIIGSLNE